MFLRTLQCNHTNRRYPDKNEANFEISQSQVEISTMKLRIILYSEPVQNLLRTILILKDINTESWSLCKSSWIMFWLLLGWLRLKAGSKEIWTIRTIKRRRPVTNDCFNYSKKSWVFFCCVNHLSGTPRKQMFTWTWWISIRLFVSVFHWVRCSVWGNHRLVCFEDFFWSFFIFVTCKNKAMSASFPRQKFH